MRAEERQLRAVVIGAAPEPRGAELIGKDDFIAVCDGGLEYAQSQRLSFEMLVGDFDSYTGALPEGGFELIRLPCEKDDTDIGFAVKTLLARGFREFLLLGAAGGRLDHTLGNLAVAGGVAEAGGICTICGAAPGEMIYVFRDRALELTPAPGAYVSLFPLGAKTTAVTLEGFKYPLRHGRLSALSTLGVSNEFAPAGSPDARVPARITAERGTVVAVVNYPVS
ncbi:MAG: thiamine diphosphokinase [Clostridia bacterium]|nr:thiamine diphosphokinase [Clostridia bacterium]